jgi:tetratricopeptide (TPR) repeat protein
MKKTLKTILLFSLIALTAYFVYFYLTFENEDLDILGDLSEIRATRTKEGLELARYYDHLDIIDSLRENNYHSAALNYLDTLTNLGIFEDNFLLERGKIYFDLGEYELAKIEFSKLLRISENRNKKALVWRSYSYLELNMCDSAILDIENAYSANPTFEKEYLVIKEHCDDLK